MYKNTTSPREKERENVSIHVLWKGILWFLSTDVHTFIVYTSKASEYELKHRRGRFTSCCVNNQNHHKEKKGFTFIAGCLWYRFVGREKKAHFQSIITINKHFGNQSNTYNNKYYNTLDYLHVWFIGCVCFYNKAPFHFKY